MERSISLSLSEILDQFSIFWWAARPLACCDPHGVAYLVGRHFVARRRCDSRSRPSIGHNSAMPMTATRRNSPIRRRTVSYCRRTRSRLKQQVQQRPSFSHDKYPLLSIQIFTNVLWIRFPRRCCTLQRRRGNYNKRGGLKEYFYRKLAAL